jgi:site-specific DNA-methyltransferase (adenine-specific)
MMSETKPGVINLSKDDEYETPPDLFKQACADYGIFPKLDVCATEENTKCIEYIEPSEDALSRDWIDHFFMNPPYSQVEKWVRQAYIMHKKYNITGLALIFSKTDTKWWHECIEGKAEVHFIKGRIKFWKNGKPTKNPAPYPSCFVIWRKK